MAAADSAPIDVTYLDRVTQTVFNGNWSAQPLTEAEYRKRFETKESAYTRALGLLTAAVTRADSPSEFLDDDPVASLQI